MIGVVVVLNVLISLLCLYVAWYVWNLRRALQLTAEVLTLFERDTHNVLYGAPDAISQGQLGVRGMRGSYQQLEMQLQQVQQVLAFLGLVKSLWRVALFSSTRVGQSSNDVTMQRSRASLGRSSLGQSKRQRRQQRSRR